jgi:hypothetical protein
VELEPEGLRRNKVEVWKQLNREGEEVARCTVERPMNGAFTPALSKDASLAIAATVLRMLEQYLPHCHAILDNGRFGEGIWTDMLGLDFKEVFLLIKVYQNIL